MEYAKSSGRYETIAYSLIAVTFLLCLYRALIYPLTNTDSIVYHLPRAFYYYKMHKVSNLPSNYIVMNYTAPACEIIISHLLLLSHGSDRLANLVQLPTFMILAIAARQAVLKLKVQSIVAALMALLTVSIPLVMLQSVTTQNDLVAAGFSLLSVLFAIRICEKTEEDSLLQYLLFGVSAGLGVYTKITAAIIIFPFGFLILGKIIKERNFNGMRRLTGAVGSAILINLPYWIRNAMDWGGDFLALKASSYMSAEVKPSYMDYLGRLILNLGYCMGGRFNLVNKGLIYLLENIYVKMGADECERWEFFFVSPVATHDSNPYGILIVIMILSAVIVLFIGSKREKLYSVSWICALLITSLITRAFIPSIARYLLPVCVAGTVGIGIVAREFGMRKRIGRTITIAFCVLALSNIQYCNIYDSAQPVLAWPSVYNQRKEEIYYDYCGWKDTSNHFMDVLEENGIIEVGIWEESICAIYPMLACFTDDKYSVRSIAGEYGSNYVSPSFMPGAIIYVGQRDMKNEILQYNGKAYRLAMVGEYLGVNESQAYLYVGE